MVLSISVKISEIYFRNQQLNVPQKQKKCKNQKYCISANFTKTMLAAIIGRFLIILNPNLCPRTSIYE